MRVKKADTPFAREQWAKVDRAASRPTRAEVEEDLYRLREENQRIKAINDEGHETVMTLRANLRRAEEQCHAILSWVDDDSTIEAAIEEVIRRLRGDR